MYNIKLNKRQGNMKLIKLQKSLSLKKVQKDLNLYQVGRRGPAGEGDKNFVQSFTNSAEVTVVHGLAKRPSISIEDSAGDEVEADVRYVDLNTMLVRFSSSFSGKIICN